MAGLASGTSHHQQQQQPQPPKLPRYHEDLRAPVRTVVGAAPHALVHRAEWAKVLAGDPVEINPSVGAGYRVMSATEWAARFKTSPELPECLACGSVNTKEHAFSQTWCRGKRKWFAESLCLDCLQFSHRSYADPDFMTPEQYVKSQLWGADAIARLAAGGGA